jgi:hypothetical protein
VTDGYVPRGGGRAAAGWEEGKGGGMSGSQDMKKMDVMIDLWHQCCLSYSRVESRYLQYSTCVLQAGLIQS